MSYVIIFTVDVLTSGHWSLLKNLQDQKLQDLANALPATVLCSKASSTTTKYLGAFRRWKSWAKEFNLPIFPATATHVALYLQHLGQTKGSKAASEEAVHGIAWAHSMAGLPSPTADPFVRSVLEGLKRSLAKPTIKKAPFTSDMLKSITDDALADKSLASIRLAAMCLIGFAGFFRYNELCNIRLSDMELSPSHLKIKVRESKGDQLRQGDEVVIARAGFTYCPVLMLETYLKMAGISPGSDGFLFRGIISGKVQTLRPTGNLSYTRFSELLKQKLKDLGLPPVDFSPHSLRSGGATAAAGAGVPDRIFKRHGRWKSENAKDGYVKDSLESRLSVTKNLGL